MTITDIQILSNDLRQLDDEYLNSLYDMDQTAYYYKFIYRLVKLLKPKLTVELGVCTGRGTAHLAAGNLNGKVIGIDPNPDHVNNILDNILLKYPNIDLRLDISTSTKILNEIAPNSVDICFVDTIHTYNQVIDEVKAWLPKMVRGGVMLFDDITYSDEMIKAWDEITLEKISLPHLHHSGFGVAIV